MSTPGPAAAPAAPSVLESLAVPQTAVPGMGGIVTEYSSTPPAAAPAVVNLDTASTPVTTPVEGAPAEVPAAEPQPLVDPYPVTTPDGSMVNIWVDDGYGGQRLYTQIANTPQAIAEYTQRNLQRLHELSTQPRQPVVPPAPAEPPPDPIVERRARITARAKEIAQAKYGLDQDGNPANVDPLAESMAELAEEIFGELESKQEAAQKSARINAEIAKIQKIDPRFDLNIPKVAEFAAQLRSYISKQDGIPFEQVTPRMVHGEMLRLEAEMRAEQALNGQPPLNGQQPARPGVPVSPPSAFTSPTGSQPITHGTGYENHPEVGAAVAEYEKTMRNMGRPITQEGRQMIANIQIDCLKNRGKSPIEMSRQG